MQAGNLPKGSSTNCFLGVPGSSDLKQLPTAESTLEDVKQDYEQYVHPEAPKPR